ncbi:MAG TPA: acyltransferase [Thermohalobaculum sp.]|nr:acyltransferase [Thermohalobaculum sp.]
MTIFAQARSMAEQTPDRRNRAADFFRAVSIILVVFGHWFLIAPYVDQGELRFAELLGVLPWTHLATWVFQVMPVFFIVGGFANASSWASARRDPERRRAWQAVRLRRLLVPTVPLVALWCIAAAIARFAEVPPELIRDGSRAALIPVWFLAVYIMVTVVVPVSTEIWRRYGLVSVAALAAAAVCVDLIAFIGGESWLRWANYGFIWLAMHQLGYWWHGGGSGRHGPVVLLFIGLVSLALLVGPLGYPLSMVSVPGAEISNSKPPTVAMLAIGCVQGGLMLLVEKPVSRWLRSVRAWFLVILVSRMIMTVYLWHITALIALVGLSLLVGGPGLDAAPGGTTWWLWRPVWIAALIAALLPFLLVFGSLEAGSRRAHTRPPGPVRATLGAVMTCAGLTFLALNGAGADNLLGVNAIPALLALIGVGLSTVGGAERTKSR